MQRYFIDESKLAINETIELNKEISHHMLKVMRNQPEDKIHLITTEGDTYEGVFYKQDQGQAKVKVTARLEVLNTELSVDVTIACGLSKNDKLDWIVQKSTECGMASFIPVSLRRDVVKWPAKKVDQRVERLQKIAQEAAQQSYRLKVPKIHSLQSLEQLFTLSEQYDHLLIAYEETAKKDELNTLLKAHRSLKKNDRILILFGSEGGFDSKEIEQLEEKGFKPVGLGPRILRAETAPIYYLSTLSYVNDITKEIG